MIQKTLRGNITQRKRNCEIKKKTQSKDFRRKNQSCTLGFRYESYSIKWMYSVSFWNTHSFPIETGWPKSKRNWLIFSQMMHWRNFVFVFFPPYLTIHFSLLGRDLLKDQSRFTTVEAKLLFVGISKAGTSRSSIGSFFFSIFLVNNTGCAVQSARHLFQSNLTIWQPWFEYIGLNESSGKGFSISLPKSKKKCKVGWVQPFECKYWRWKNDSTLQACHFAPMFGISLRAWQMKAETVSFQWKKRESGYLLRGKSYGAFCGNIDSAFFSLCIKIRLDLLTENGPKRFLVLTHCLQMAITRLSFEISLITFFSLKDECHASTSKQKVQSSVARLEYEKKKIGEPTARRTLYNPLFLLLGFWYIKVWLKYT